MMFEFLIKRKKSYPKN